MKVQLNDYHHAARTLLRGRGTPLVAVLVLCFGVFTRLEPSGVTSDTKLGRLPLPVPRP